MVALPLASLLACLRIDKMFASNLSHDTMVVVVAREHADRVLSRNQLCVCVCVCVCVCARVCVFAEILCLSRHHQAGAFGETDTGLDMRYKCTAPHKQIIDWTVTLHLPHVFLSSISCHPTTLVNNQSGSVV